MRANEAAAHNEYQLRYYERRQARAIEPREGAYERRHVEELLGAAGLAPGQRVLEVGAGLGRFTRLLAARGLQVVASDLSPGLLSRLERDGAGSVATLAGDVAALPQLTAERFDGVLGFFVLHHLFDLEQAFAAIARVLKPGAPAAFCEPNGWNPLFYAQIALTPGMTWKGDGGVRHMRPSVVLPAMARAGLTNRRCARYGFVPPALAARPAGRALERWLERRRPLDPVRAFQVFSGRLDAGAGR
jgi:SAM-dependent methyltransferase